MKVIDLTLLDKVSSEAKESPRLRMNYNFSRPSNAIDGHERAEHFQRLLREYNEWMQNQQRQQKAVQRFLREYYY